MAQYWTCKYGANHDCGERCDCMEAKEMEERMERKRMEAMVVQERGGQMVLNLPVERGVAV